MKRTINYLFGLVTMLGMVTMISCEGPEGPAGSDGTPGTDGNVSCLECHTSVKMDAIEDAYAEHPHTTGSGWGRGTSGSCAACHSDEGFIDVVQTGGSGVTGNGTPLDCGACHVDHVSLEDDIDAPVREVGAVSSVAVEGATYEHGAGNLCATCHQARRTSVDYDDQTVAMTYTRKFTGEDIAVYENAAVGPNGTITLDQSGTEDTLVVVFDVPTDYVYTNSTHAGPHHGPQANVFAADVGTVTGTPFDRDHHTDCSSCHLSDTTAASGYGHNFTPDIGMCNDCHGDAFDMETEMADIQTRLDAVSDALVAIHAIHVDEDGVHPLYASLPRAEWNAFWDFMVLYEDNSKGVHNFAYAKQLLTAAENALGK